jgi:hypothetical protein
MMTMMMMMIMKGWEPPHRLIHNASHGLLWKKRMSLNPGLSWFHMLGLLHDSTNSCKMVVVTSTETLRKFQHLFMSTIIIVIV